jgi:CRISPR system Cascade subunit CasA
MVNTLTEAVIRTRGRDDSAASLSLPGVMAGLARGEIASFPALRPHQRHVWHAFLVQLATLALLKAGRSELPESEDDWRELIHGLTPDWPDDEPWLLVVEDVTKPALLQPPVPREEFSDFKPIAAPDALDMLVTSKNHDLKSEVASGGQADDWLFALISLQTQEGVMGAGGGKYGISRMNSGFGSRPGLGVAINGDPGARFRRDVSLLLAGADQDGIFPEWQQRNGIALLWLELWSRNDAPISPDRLSRLYIEVCRRVRLVPAGGGFAACAGGSKKARVAASDWELKGNTGDPWMPVEQVSLQGLSIGGGGFHYRKLVELMSDKYKTPYLAEVHGNDPDEGLQLVATAVARGQGKTEGYHERAIPVPKRIKSIVALRDGRDKVAKAAQERVTALGELRGALRRGLAVLAQGGPDKTADKPTTNGFIEPWLKRFEAEVDRDFFPELWAELAEDAPQARQEAYRAWKLKRRRHAGDLLEEASGALPLPVARRYRAKVKAASAFHGRLQKADAFKETYSTSPEEAA